MKRKLTQHQKHHLLTSFIAEKLSQWNEQRQTEAHVFEHHQVINKEDTFALEQLPNGLSPLPLGLR